MDDYTQPGQHFKPVHIDSLSPNDWRYAYFNRQSDTSNAHGHQRYLPMLAAEHAKLSPNESFNPHLFTDSGDANILRCAFSSEDIEAALAETYFEKLTDALKQELQSTQKLCAVFPSQDRIFRPLGYNPQGGTFTWVYTAEDFALFQKWLEYILGARVADVQFAVIDNNTPGIVRSNSIKSGQAISGNSGGRPRIISPQEEVCRLRIAHDWKSGQIQRHLLKQYKIEVSVKSVQRWLRAKGLQAEPGRPYKAK